MGAGTVRWSGTFTMSASGPGAVSSTTVTISGFDATDRVVATPSSTASQSANWNDTNGPFTVEIVKSSGSFVAYCDRSQLPGDVTFDYIVLTNST
jgi:hypothetical protein